MLSSIHPSDAATSERRCAGVTAWYHGGAEVPLRTVGIPLQRFHIDVLELDLHRGPDMKLEAQEPFERAPLLVVVHDNGGHVAVDHVDERGAAGYEVDVIPVARLDRGLQLVRVHFEVADDMFRRVRGDVDRLPAPREKGPAALFINHP